ncbi:MAG TPA: hypothetical protein VHV83_14860 [Armatimonadota bacterium]|nr:hypothetical protein [Armatimonadota bacterium]
MNHRTLVVFLCVCLLSCLSVNPLFADEQITDLPAVLETEYGLSWQLLQRTALHVLPEPYAPCYEEPLRLSDHSSISSAYLIFPPIIDNCDH